jgi:glycosyltransferase involved in cell wall biosynthesis
MSFNDKLIFDARHIENEFSGLGRYTYHLLSGLLELSDKFNEIKILVCDDLKENNSLYSSILKKLHGLENVCIHTVPIKPFSIKNFFFLRSYINCFEGYHYFYPHFDLPLGLKIKCTFVVHDLFPLVVKGYIVKNSFLKKIIFKLLCAHSLVSSDKCIAISNSTRNDILDNFKFGVGNIKMVHSAPCLNFTGLDSLLPINAGRFLFYIGDRRPHKNIKMMIDIFSELKNSFGYPGDFIVAGSVKNYDFDVDEYVLDKPYVKLVGNLSDTELLSYYNNMEALFFTSKYEGFGLPILESAVFNKKIITSNTSSLPEVTPENGLMLDLNLSLKENSKIVNNYINQDMKINNEHFLSNFSWKLTANRIFIED